MTQFSQAAYYVRSLFYTVAVAVIYFIGSLLNGAAREERGGGEDRGGDRKERD